MQSEIKRVSGELQAWCDKQTIPAIRMRGTIILGNLVRLATNPGDVDLLRMTKQNVVDLEVAAALMRRRRTSLSGPCPYRKPKTPGDRERIG